MNSPVKAVFFDLFATLISVNKAAAGKGRDTAEVLGLDPKVWNAACFSEHHDICGPSNQLDIIRKLAHSLDSSIPESLIEEATRHRQWRFDHALMQVETEILGALVELKACGIRLGVISNASTDEVRAWPDSPLRPLFDKALFSCECGLKKPNPAIYQMGLKHLGVEAGQALFVGDGGSREHSGAAQSGIRSYLVTHFIGHHSEEKLQKLGEGSMGRIGHISELVAIVAD